MFECMICFDFFVVSEVFLYDVCYVDLLLMGVVSYVVFCVLVGIEMVDDLKWCVLECFEYGDFVGVMFYIMLGMSGEVKLLFNVLVCKWFDVIYGWVFVNVLVGIVIVLMDWVVNLFIVGGFFMLYDGVNWLLEVIGVNVFLIGWLDVYGVDFFVMLNLIGCVCFNVLVGMLMSVL